MNILALAWIGMIAFGIIMYVILDGFDLGIGILFPFFKSEHEKDLMISTILPVWDGNETWLVFGGAALYGAFPLAFATVLPLFYLPMLVMVIALLFRGVAFEFRLKAILSKPLWDICFFIGSLFATIAQGLILGTFVEGIKAFAPYESVRHQWLDPFPIFCAIALVFGYALLGANRLIIKTEGGLQKKSYAISNVLQYLMLLFLIAVSVWSPFLDPAIKERWFNPSNMAYLAVLPVVSLLFLFGHWHGIRRKKEHWPFWSSIGVFLMCYIGFIISSYPYIVPRHMTYTAAAASHSSLLFMLVGACVMLPPLLYYTYYSYKIFKGKVTQRIGY